MTRYTGRLLTAVRLGVHLALPCVGDDELAHTHTERGGGLPWRMVVGGGELSGRPLLKRRE